MTKNCPFCVAEIPTEARKCKFCGEWVEKSPNNAPTASSGQEAKLVVPFTVCPSCQVAAPGGALLCVQCGYDVRLGQKRYVRYQPPAPAPGDLPTITTAMEPRSGSDRWRTLLPVIAVLGILLLGLVVCLGWEWSAQADEYQERAGRSFADIGLALQMYAQDRGQYPTNIHDAQGKPLLSWRVEILPYLNMEQLYKEFKKDEPWDGDHNRKLLTQIPSVYAPGADIPWLARRNPRLRVRPIGFTFIQGFIGKGTVFEPNAKVTRDLIDAKDGNSNTLALVDAGTAVPWTKPEDLPYTPSQPLPPLGGLYADSKVIAVLCDSKPVAIRPDADAQKLREYITYDDGQPAAPEAVFGSIPVDTERGDFLRFWGPITGGSVLGLLLLVLFLRWWLVLSDR